MTSPVVLGPQRPNPNAPQVLRELSPGTGPIVVLTAGWRSDELDEEVVQRHLGPEAAVLPLYSWFEVVMRELPDLRAAYRARQDALVDLRRLHRIRLHRALEVVRELIEQPDTEIVRETLLLAVEDVRRIDRQLTTSAAAIHADHARASEPWTAHPSIARLRERATVALNGSRAVAIAGGHVAVLLNRMQFFGVDEVLARIAAEGRPIVAWSAGSMILTDNIVLFYDDPPDGPAFPELLDRGFGIVPGVVLLPHARQRLRLDQPARVAALATRFGPAACIGTENGAWLVREGERWANRGPPETAFQLMPSGEVCELPGVRRGAPAAGGAA
jgi:hypothetical protein